MTYVVSDKCIECKYTDCVEVCPVNCFHEGENMLVIDPELCIDCTLCETECPIGAIYADHELPQDQQQMLAVNGTFARKWPAIAEMRPIPEAAAAWEQVNNKYPLHFSREPGR
ncbi:MAG: ferredoxin family protein [Pseudomonadales bacterium]